MLLSLGVGGWGNRERSSRQDEQRARRVPDEVAGHAAVHQPADWSRRPDHEQVGPPLLGEPVQPRTHRKRVADSEVSVHCRPSRSRSSSL